MMYCRCKASIDSDYSRFLLLLFITISDRYSVLSSGYFVVQKVLYVYTVFTIAGMVVLQNPAAPAKVPGTG